MSSSSEFDRPIVVDPVLEEKVRKAKERISENLHILANEPSLAFYRLQENTRKSMPRIIERKVEAEKLKARLQGTCYDLEYAIEELNTINSTNDKFKNILELCKMSLVTRQQLANLKNKRSKKDISVYKRLSAHITLDLPDTSPSDTLRGIANRDETISRNSSIY